MPSRAWRIYTACGNRPQAARATRKPFLVWADFCRLYLVQGSKVESVDQLVQVVGEKTLADLAILLRHRAGAIGKIAACQVKPL